MASPAPPLSLSTLLLPRPATRDADSVPSDSSGGNDAGEARRRAETPVTDAPRGNPIVILDSGAAYHCTSEKQWLSDFAAAAPDDDRSAVHRTRGGLDLLIAGAGVLATENFHLPSVLYMAGLFAATVVVSVNQLTRLGYPVMFGDGQCLVMDRRGGGKLVGQGRLQEDDGLYRLEFLKIPIDDADADGTNSSVVSTAADHQIYTTVV